MAGSWRGLRPLDRRRATAPTGAQPARLWRAVPPTGMSQMSQDYLCLVTTGRAQYYSGAPARPKDFGGPLSGRTRSVGRGSKGNRRFPWQGGGPGGTAGSPGGGFGGEAPARAKCVIILSPRRFKIVSSRYAPENVGLSHKFCKRWL